MDEETQKLVVDAYNQGMEDQERRTQHRDLPDSLHKATEDPFDYACALHNGSVIFFSEAVYRGGDWVHLRPPISFPSEDMYPPTTLKLPFERGVDVRLSEIA